MGPNARRTLWIVAGALVLVALVQGHNITTQEIILFCVVVPSIILHEISHGAVAWAFGDDTAKRAGRLTLNPIRHVDPVGTLIVPALLVLGGYAFFGWAKPVPVNNGRLRHPRNEGLLVSLAGPFTNALLAGITALIFITQYRHHALQFGISGVAEVIFLASLVNVGLMVFNLIPIPPLDGSAVFERLLPRRWWPTYLRIRPYTMFIILGLVLLNYLLKQHGPITVAFNHLYNWWKNILVYGRS
jgi:Zn-dependent protease